MCGIIDALLFDELREPSLCLRSCELGYVSDYHGASGSLNLTQYIDAVPADVLLPLIQTEPLCPDLRDIDLLSRRFGTVTVATLSGFGFGGNGSGITIAS